jgi:hypothetical protein
MLASIGLFRISSAKAVALVRLICVFLLLVFAVFSYTRASAPTRVSAATSSNLNFQARLYNSSGSVVPDGNYNIEFNLYNVSSGGTSEWTEAYTGGDRVRVVNGYLSVYLGSLTSFPGTINWDQDHWITMNVGGTGGAPVWDGEMTPRLKLTAVPYAFQSKYAESLNKVDGSFTGILDFLSLTANRTINLPNASGTVCLEGDPGCIDVATTNDTSTTSSNSGLEISTDGLRLLGGCSDGQLLTWNETSKVWQCTTTAAAAPGFGTIDAPSGTDPVGDGPNDTLNLSITGSNFTITGDSATDALTFDIVETALAGNGLSANGNALDVNTGNGLEINSDSVRINQDFAFTWTNSHTWNLAETEGLSINSSVSGTNSSTAETITITNSSSSGTQSGLYIDNAASTGTTDALLVLDNSDTDTAVTSAIQIINAGGGFTNLFDVAGTMISVGEFTVLDGGIAEGEVSGVITDVTAGSGLTGGGSSGNATLDIGAGNGISVAADAISVIYGSTANTSVAGDTSLTCGSGTGDLSGGGNSITLGSGGTCNNITISESPVFDTSVTTPLITYGGALTLQTSATGGADDLLFRTAGAEVMRILENGDLRFEKGTNDVTVTFATPGSPATYTFSGATGTVLTSANYGTTLDTAYVNTAESPATGDVSGSFSAGLLVNSVQNNSVDLTTDTVGNYVATITAGNGLSGDATGEGSAPTMSVNTGNGLEINSDSVRINQDFAFTWTNSHTWNLAETEGLSINSSVSGTNSSTAETITITNSSSSGTQSGLYIDNAASTGTTDALLVLDNSDTDTAVTSAIQIINAGGGFTNLFDVAGTMISVGEFTLLDTKNAALVDVNDVVNTAITGTGALDQGSITSNFGAINVGTDNISTTGMVFANDFDRTSAGALTFGNTNATSVGICNSVNCDTITIGTNTDADTITIGDNNDTFSLDTSAFDISSVGALSGITTVNASGAITAANAGNTINGLIVNSGSLSAITGYNQTSGNFSYANNSGDFVIDSDSFDVSSDGTLTVRTTNSSAFKVENASGLSMLNADSSANIVSVGSSTGDATGILFVLDTKNTAGDPTGVNGGMYYNSSAQRFRCYEGGAWDNCTAAGNNDITIQATATTWTNMPAADTEFAGTSYRTWVNLSQASEFRFIMRVPVAGAGTADCRVQYATSDSGPWANLAASGTGELSIGSAGTLATSYADIAVGAKTDVIVRVMCKDGNATADPQFRNVSLRTR